MDSVKIYLLGRFEILVNDMKVTSQLLKSRKSVLLIQYLILHRGQAISYQALYDLIWPQEEIANPESALKTLVSRLRESLRHISPTLHDCIGTSRGAYVWVDQENVTVDVFEFEDLCRQLKGITMLDETASGLFSRVYDLYLGDLLSSGSTESWAVRRSVYYQDLYLSAVYQHLELLRSLERYDEIITVCRVALDINAFDERLQIAMMDALVKTNRVHDALIQYRHAEEMDLHYLGMPPSQNMQAYYRRITDTGKLMEEDLNSIRSELGAVDNEKGAYFCDLPVFRQLFKLQCRFLRRNGTVNLFLVLIRLISSEKKEPDPIEKDETMRVLAEIMKHHLRSSDIITRYSSDQFLLLLAMKTYDDGKSALERIRRAFYASGISTGFSFHYRISPAEDDYKPFSTGKHDDRE